MQDVTELLEPVAQRAGVAVQGGPLAVDGRAFGEELQLRQALVNLVMNAADAIQGNGQLSIRTEYLELNAQSSDRPPDLEPGSYARLSVIDDGEGMDPEVLSRAFEPIFTTKEVGKGTGLG